MMILFACVSGEHPILPNVLPERRSTLFDSNEQGLVLYKRSIETKAGVLYDLQVSRLDAGQSLTDRKSVV